MFCPKCGRDDSHRHKFCPSCGTNLDVVTIALSTGEYSIFTRVNKHLDRSVARYADHFFESATTTAREGQVGSSWRLVGKGVLTFFIDLALLPVMFFFLPIRLLLLLFYTPLGLLQERSERKRSGVYNSSIRSLMGRKKNITGSKARSRKKVSIPLPMSRHELRTCPSRPVVVALSKK